LQLDESTLPSNESLLLAFVRFIKEEQICQELLFAKLLETDTKGKSIFDVLEMYFKEKCIPFTNIVSIATDGAPAMTGLHRGFISFLKNLAPNIIAVHCVIHRQHLVAKNLVVTVTNNTQSHALSDRLFRKLSDGNDEDFNQLLLHTEVCWLSNSTCLKRFYEIFKPVTDFFEDNGNMLRKKLLLQGNDLNWIKAKTTVCAFNSKLKLFKQYM